MTEQEFLMIKHSVHYKLYRDMIHTQDHGIVKTKKYAPAWIDVSCKMAKKSIYACVGDEHLCVYRGLMPQLMNPDMRVKLLFNKWPSDINDIMMVSMLMQAGKAKVCKTDPNWVEYLSVDTKGFLLHYDQHKYYLSANNFNIAKKINEIVTEKWCHPTHIITHAPINPFEQIRSRQK